MSHDAQIGDLDSDNTTTLTEGQTQKQEETPTSQQSCTNRCISILRSNPLYTDVSNVFHWREPLRSGLLFGIFNFVFLLITWGGYSVVTLISYLFLALIVVCFSYVNFVVLKAKWISGKAAENPLQERFKTTDFHVSKEIAEKHLNTVLELTNITIDSCREVLYCTNVILSLQAAAMCYATATVGGWFAGATLLYLVVLGFFIWPRLYEEKQKEIDALYAVALTHLNNYYQLALSKIPPGVTAKLPFLKPKNT